MVVCLSTRNRYFSVVLVTKQLQVECDNFKQEILLDKFLNRTRAVLPEMVFLIYSPDMQYYKWHSIASGGQVTYGLWVIANAYRIDI
jgi:hypothetical protein